MSDKNIIISVIATFCIMILLFTGGAPKDDNVSIPPVEDAPKEEGYPVDYFNESEKMLN